MMSDTMPGLFLRDGPNIKSWIRHMTWLVMLAGLAPGICLAEMIQQPTAVETLSTVIVNGVPIAESELSREINRLAPVAEYHNLSKQRWQEIRKQAIENLIDKELFYREAIQRGIAWDEHWVEFTFEKTRGKYSADQFSHLNLDDEKVKNRLYEDLRQTYVISKLWQEGKRLSMPDPQDVRAYFEVNRDNYMSPKAIKVVELLVEMKPSTSKQEWDKAKKKINQIYRQAKKRKGFASFRKAQPELQINEKTVHEGMQGYDIELLDKMAEGDISKPIFTLKGYILLKKIKSIPQQRFSFAEVQQQVENDLLNKRYRQWFDSLKQNLRDKSKIIIGAGPAYVGR